MSASVHDPHTTQKEAARLAGQAVGGNERVQLARGAAKTVDLVHHIAHGARVGRTAVKGTDKTLELVGKLTGKEVAETTGKALLKKVPIVCSAIMTGEGLWDLGKAAYAAVKGSQDAKIYAMQGVLRVAGGGAGLASDILAVGTAGIATPVAVGVTALGFGTEATAGELEKMRLNGEKPTWKDLAKGHVTEQAGVDAWHFAKRVGTNIEEHAQGVLEKLQHAF